MREYWAQEAAMMRDTSAVLENNAFSVVTSPKNPFTFEPIQECLDTWAIQSVWNVRSLELEKHDIDTESAWAFVKSKYFIAKIEAEETIRDVGSRIPNSQKDSVQQLLTDKPWAYTIESLNNGGFDWRKYDLHNNKYGELEVKHNQLIANLSSNDLKGFKTSMQEFKAAIKIFVVKLKIYLDENKEDIGYNRFNNFYEDITLDSILKNIPLIKFTNCEIKALNMQETGDFTNTTITGFKNKKLGLTTSINSSGSGIEGLCQLPAVSAQEAYLWAKNKNITTLTPNRDMPQNAIYLSAAYIGRIVDILLPEISRINTCLDKKRIVFAAYNAGPGTLKKAINAFFLEKKNLNLTWANSKFQDNLKTQTKLISSTKYVETQNYPTNIEKRLTTKKD